MTADLGQPIGHREIIRQINAQKAAEANARANTNANENRSAGQNQRDNHRDNNNRARITAFRDETTGQFYAMSHEDRMAFDDHCGGIVHDLQPANHRERWLATSIAEDQWRLNRARALESNIFALGISNPTIEIDAGSAEANAAINQARVWLADGKKLQMLALYEQRIRRSIEKNEKQLKELQTERQAAYNKALEEEKLLAQLAILEGETYAYEGECSIYPGKGTTGMNASGQNGFGFSTSQITRLAHREIRLRRAAHFQKTAPKSTAGSKGTPFPTPKAA
jgi:hypothetical protein